MNDYDLIDNLTHEYGEKYRLCFINALDFLYANQHKWLLKFPIDKEAYLRGLCERFGK